MTQKVFADFVGIAPATLSGIINDRTKPTINIVEAIKKKIPAISTDWLMFGIGSMYASRTVDDGTHTPTPSGSASDGVMPPGSTSGAYQETLLDFEQSVSSAPSPAYRSASGMSSPRSSRPELEVDFMKNFDKMPRRVTEIRVFYDDQTWESFVPAKK